MSFGGVIRRHTHHLAGVIRSHTRHSVGDRKPWTRVPRDGAYPCASRRAVVCIIYSHEILSQIARQAPDIYCFVGTVSSHIAHLRTLKNASRTRHVRFTHCTRGEYQVAQPSPVISHKRWHPPLELAETAAPPHIPPQSCASVATSNATSSVVYRRPAKAPPGPIRSYA